MKQEVLKHAADLLLTSKRLTGGDEPKYLPKIFIVNGHCYYYLNAARRAAYGTNYPIVVMTIEEAWEISTLLHRDSLKQEDVAWEFDQTGETFNGRLFDDRRSILANMVKNPVIPLVPNP